MEWIQNGVATWFLGAVFLACGLVCVLRAVRVRAARAAWALIGAGLLLYAGGSVVYNLELAAGGAVSFPSLADALRLSLCPLSFAGMVALVHARHVHVNASLWLDALIGGSVVAAVAAVFLLPPLAEMTAGQGWVSAAHLAYPLGDLLLMGFAVVLWGAGRWRSDAWFGLAAGFALIAMSDGVYVAAQAGDGWVPGSTADLGYAAGSVLLAASAWRSQPPPVDVSATARMAMPITFTVASFALVSYEAFTELDLLAVALIRLTLLAVVLRLGLTLWWLSRQRADLEALAASDPLTGLGNYRAFQEHLDQAVASAALRDEPVSVVVLDLDHFKALNDTFGHAEGDRVLQATATTLARTVGEGASSRASGARSSRSSCRARTSRRPPPSPSAAAPRWPRSRAPAPRSRARPASRRSRRTPTAWRGCCTPPTARCTGPSARAATASASSTRATSSRCRCTSSAARSRPCSPAPSRSGPLSSR